MQSLVPICNDSLAKLVTGEKNYHFRAVAKPDRQFFMLCKFFCVYRLQKESISKEMNDNDQICIA